MYNAIKENLKDALEISKTYNFDLILSGGSLLGAYREGGKPIKGDEDDVDFAVSHQVARFKFKEVLLAFLDRGFKIKRLRDTVVSFKRGESHIDLIFYKEWDENYYYETLYHKGNPFALFVPKEHWDNLSTIEFVGLELKCPKDVEGFLTYRYGDWETPIPREKFGFEFFINKGIIKWIK